MKYHRFEEAAWHLLETGCDLNVQCDGQNALGQAIQRYLDDHYIRLLIQSGCEYSEYLEHDLVSSAIASLRESRSATFAALLDLDWDQVLVDIVIEILYPIL